MNDAHPEHERPGVDEIAFGLQGRASTARRLVLLLAPYRKRFAFASAALVGGSMVGLAYPEFVRRIANTALKASSTERLDAIFGVVALLFLVEAVLAWFRQSLTIWIGERVVTDLRNRVFERMLSLPPSWFQRQPTGELVGRMAADVTLVQGVVGTQLAFAVQSVVQLTGSLVLLMLLNPPLVLILGVAMPLLVISGGMFGRIVRARSSRVHGELAHGSGYLQEVVAAMGTVQAFGREQLAKREYRARVEKAFDSARGLARWQASFFSTELLGMRLVFAAILWVGGQEVIGGTSSTGDLVAFAMYMGLAASSATTLTGVWGMLQRAAGAVERLFAIMDTTSDIREPASPIALPPGPGELSLSNVCFSYEPGVLPNVLRSVSFDVSAGEVVAIVGPSGSGKSTLLYLLLRFHDVTEGQISYAGIDVRELSLRDIRSVFAVVPQEPVLFTGSIRDNIAFGRSGATDEEISRAAALANAAGFIGALPDGYDSQVGERGVKLSAGQKQRIAIARAVVADPRILVLDEATSSLDAESEVLVQAALNTVMRNRTTLVIAHRLSTVRNADRILFLDSGRILECGSHEDLMRRRGAYRRLVEQQLSVA